MNDLRLFQDKVALTLIGLANLHVPVLVALAIGRGQDAMLASVLGFMFAALPTWLYLSKRSVRVVGYGLAVAYVGQTSLLVFLLNGHPWQIEAHFYYFVLLAMLAGLCEWRVILLAAVLIAVHHFSLNYLLPSAIYPGGTDFLRVLFHALFVVVETAMLIAINLMLRAAFESAYAAQFKAEQSARELERFAGQRSAEFEVTSAHAKRLQALMVSFEREIADSIDALHHAAHELQTNARGLGVTAENASSQSVKVAAITDNTSVQVRAVAGAGDSLAKSFAEVGASVSESSRLAGAAVKQASQTAATIDELARVAAEIGNVTSLISAIAAQTNLLALNATIEAARAGDAGRGFAVVAQEVKALAAQTARATQDIASRIAAMQTVTGRSVEAMQEISSTIAQLDNFSGRIAATVEEQVASAHDIAGNIGSVAEGVGSLSSALGQIEAVAEKANRAAAELNGAAASVAEQTSKIRERISTFTGGVAKLGA